MNTLLEELKRERISALKNGDAPYKDVLSLILAAIKQVEVDTRKELTEADVIQILTKMVKQRQESINLYMQGGRYDLAEIETFEKKIIETFLPEQISEEEAAVLIAEAIREIGPTSPKDIGKVIGLLRTKLEGRYDMGKASAMVKASLG